MREGEGERAGSCVSQRVPACLSLSSPLICVCSHLICTIVTATNSAGQRSHMVEFLFGSRSCDAGDDGDACTAHRALGGWGPDRGGEAVPVPNANVLFANNLLVNPKRRPASQFFEVGLRACVCMGRRHIV